MATVYPYIGGTPSKAKFDNNSGEALSGGKIYFYVAGTSTPKDTYSESTGTTANANPVILDSRGEANIFLLADEAYKVVVKDSDDVTIYTVDNVWAPAGTNGLLTLTKFLGSMGVPVNFSLSASVAADALTSAFKTSASADASASNPIYVPFPSSTATSGAIVWRSITAASSITVPSGATLGHNSALKQYIYKYALDSSGTVEPALSFKFFGLHGIASTTAISTAADSGTVMYSTTARTDVPFTCVGMYEVTETTAGTWATAPSAVRLAPFTLPVISFSAHKNGTNQTAVVSATDTKVTLSTEIYDNGGLFDATTNYRWVPPPGHVELKGSLLLLNSSDGGAVFASIAKNGSVYKQYINRAPAANNDGSIISISDESSGSDYYELFVKHEVGSNQSVDGTITRTWLMGSWSPGRS